MQSEGKNKGAGASERANQRTNERANEDATRCPLAREEGGHNRHRGLEGKWKDATGHEGEIADATLNN